MQEFPSFFFIFQSLPKVFDHLLIHIQMINNVFSCYFIPIFCLLFHYSLYPGTLLTYLTKEYAHKLNDIYKIFILIISNIQRVLGRVGMIKLNVVWALATVKTVNLEL